VLQNKKKFQVGYNFAAENKVMISLTPLESYPHKRIKMLPVIKMKGLFFSNGSEIGSMFLFL
jgi:hypothetical protein